MENKAQEHIGNIALIQEKIGSSLVISQWHSLAEEVKRGVEFLIASDFPKSNLLPVFVERKLAHEAWYPHAAVHLWLVDDSSKVVLQKRSDTKDSNGGCWDIAVAGHVWVLADSLEDMGKKISSFNPAEGQNLKRKTAFREAFEELGIYRNEIHKLKMLDDISLADRSLQNWKDFLNAQTNRIFIWRLRKPLKDLKLQPEEVSEVSSFRITELEEAVMASMKGEQPQINLVPRHPRYYATVFSGIRKSLGLEPNSTFDELLAKTDEIEFDFEPITPSANSSGTDS